MRFTKKEWEIIKHRLEVPDAIADALGYDHDPPVEHLLRIGPNKEFTPTEEQLEILQECCEGSTFFADFDDYKHWEKTVRSLEEKLGVEIPKD